MRHEIRIGKNSIFTDLANELGGEGSGPSPHDLYDAALGQPGKPADGSDPVGAFAGPAFDPDDIAGHLAAFKIGHWKP